MWSSNNVSELHVTKSRMAIVRIKVLVLHKFFKDGKKMNYLDGKFLRKNLKELLKIFLFIRRQTIFRFFDFETFFKMFYNYGYL